MCSILAAISPIYKYLPQLSLLRRPSTEFLPPGVRRSVAPNFCALATKHNIRWEVWRLGSDITNFSAVYRIVTNQNLIQEDIKRRMNSGNACYHSVQNLLSSRLLSKRLKN
jgi:hypothetical protein